MRVLPKGLELQQVKPSATWSISRLLISHWSFTNTISHVRTSAVIQFIIGILCSYRVRSEGKQIKSRRYKTSMSNNKTRQIQSSLSVSLNTSYPNTRIQFMSKRPFFYIQMCHIFFNRLNAQLLTFDFLVSFHMFRWQFQVRRIIM